jgi:sec-independent protein translocase protein TatB
VLPRFPLLASAVPFPPKTMFDVGLTELMVIAVGGAGRHRPGAPAQGGAYRRTPARPLQRYVSDVKADINREIQLDELKKLQQQVTDQVNSLESSVTHEMREVESSVGEVVDPLERVRAMASGAASDTSAAQPDTALPESAASPAPTPEVVAAVDGAAAPAPEPAPVPAEAKKA